MHVFVVLHYKNIEETLNCINSVRQIYGNKKIIVVDNASLTKEEKKELKNKVDCLFVMDENIGFAKANNYGIKQAMALYNPEFISVINNDTLILEREWINKVQKIYDETSFDVLGPYIESFKGSGSVNPYTPLANIEQVDKELSYQHKLLKIYQHAGLYFLLQIYMKIKHLFIPRKIMMNKEQRMDNVALHGCALIFSRKYLQKYPDAFCSKTFLYHEEDFLYLRMLKDNIKMVYEPDIKIIHKEGQSLKGLKIRPKLLWKTKEIIKSLNLLRNEYEEILNERTKN